MVSNHYYLINPLRISVFLLIFLLLLSFGYVVEGADFLRDTKEDDVIISAKVTAGADLLVQPKSAAMPAASE